MTVELDLALGDLAHSSWGAATVCARTAYALARARDAEGFCGAPGAPDRLPGALTAPEGRDGAGRVTAPSRRAPGRRSSPPAGRALGPGRDGVAGRDGIPGRDGARHGG